MDAVGIQAWPLPAAVMFPSAWMLPDMVDSVAGSSLLAFGYWLLVVVTSYASAPWLGWKGKVKTKNGKARKNVNRKDNISKEEQ